MMRIVDGDIFLSGADVILHQVNCKGVMGSGVAKQIREKYPNVYEKYKALCSACPSEDLLGSIQCVPVTSPLSKNGMATIINLFAQESYGYGRCFTEYDALRRCLCTVNNFYKGSSIAIPYMLGCCRGGGNWDIVCRMIESELKDCDVTLYKFNG